MARWTAGPCPNRRGRPRSRPRSSRATNLSGSSWSSGRTSSRSAPSEFGTASSAEIEEAVPNSDGADREDVLPDLQELPLKFVARLDRGLDLGLPRRFGQGPAVHLAIDTQRKAVECHE